MTFVKDHDELIAKINNLASSARKIPKMLESNGISYAENGEYYQWLNNQFRILENSFTLFRNPLHYSSAFILIRSCFESYWLFLLAMEGKYFYKYYLAKDKNRANNIAKKWIADKAISSTAKWKNVVCIERLGKKTIRVGYKGLFDKKGNLIPYYYFLFKHFDPRDAYVGSEPRLIDNYLDIPTRVKNNQVENKGLYDNYFNIQKGLKDHLFLNKIINKKSYQRLKVHYNFLSIWIHPNIAQLEYINKNHVGTYDPFDQQSSCKYDFILSRLGLLYIGCLFSLYVKLAITFSKRMVAEGKAKKAIDIAVIEKQIREFEQSSSYFWFIFNKPHYFYKYNYCLHRLWRSHRFPKLRILQPNQVPDWQVPYYKDPYSILTQLSRSGSNEIIGEYVSPV